MNLHAEKERLRLEQERIMKSLLDQENMRDPNPSAENGYREETRQHQRGPMETEETHMNNNEAKIQEYFRR